MKKILIIISLILFVSGCYNYKELNNYAIVTGIAIDKSQKGYEVSLLVSKSKNNDSNDPIIYSKSGKTINEAIKEIELTLPKEIYIGHLSILIISDDIAKDGINKTINYFLEEEYKNNFFIVLSKNCKALEILQTNSKLTEFPSQNLANNIKITKKNQANVLLTTFNTLLYKLINKGTNLVFTSFEIEDKQAKISSMGIFKDDKLIDWANENESIGINIINNNVDKLLIETKYGSTTIKKITCKKILKDKNVFLDISANGTINAKNKIEETNIKEETKRKLENYAINAIKIAQINETDIFDIGLSTYQKSAKKFIKIDNWNRYFKKINFIVKVKLNINSNNLQNKKIERITNEKS